MTAASASSFFNLNYSYIDELQQHNSIGRAAIGVNSPSGAVDSTLGYGNIATVMPTSSSN
jgi:hypothetical protein